MSLNHQPPEQIGQSPGYDPKTAKRNSGLFGFLKWFKPSTSRESIDTHSSSSSSSSCESLNSVQSNGTVASFSYVPPSAYSPKPADKCIAPGPDTDTYRARLKQRDKRRENDKNTTLRKKYNLFFNRDTLLKPANKKPADESTKSLPLMMTRSTDQDEEAKMHRRTNSESSKTKKAGAYLHVKGKRRAPQPPGSSSQSTMSLRRKKRLAPPPPSAERIRATLESEVISNDSLKLDHGILKPAKENVEAEANTSTRSSLVVEPVVVAPRPWYKRNPTKRDSQLRHETLPEVQFARNSTIDLTSAEAVDNNNKKKHQQDEKRKSGMSFLTNISELDREASEIIRNKNAEEHHQDMPQFMRPKEELKDNWPQPKRRSAKDLIAKFNAITNVTKATVFGVSGSPKKDYFGRRSSEQERKQENLLEIHKKRIEEIDKKVNPLMKSESASAIRPKEVTPKPERKNWKCPKCNLENDYWRIICHVCSAIKPYFDDFSSSAKTSSEDLNIKVKLGVPGSVGENALERSKTQIGFSALATYNQKKKIEKSVSLEEESASKVEERERLKKMLIEMKNSLPKRKSNILMKQNSRTSVIVENPETPQEPEEKPPLEKEKSASIIVATTETVYENIKVKKSEVPKAVKVSSGVQTNSASVKEEKTSFELMRPKDFENIYSDSNNQSPARIYANLARNDELSLFFNMPKNFSQIKQNLSQAEDNNTDTIEINRLLRRLESSIAKGELTEAAIYAKELAQLKINCSVIRQKATNAKKKQGFTVEMYVEDKISHRGPFPIEVTESQTVAELKLQVEQEFEIPANVQRWILGKELATDDNASLKSHKITTEKCPVFLYLVAPEAKANAVKIEEGPSTSKTSDHIPKIVDVIPKAGPSTPSKEIPKVTTAVIDVKPIKNEIQKSEVRASELSKPGGKKAEPVPTQIVKPIKKIPEPQQVLIATKAEPEDDSLLDYDSKTLKPSKEWECHLCTLLNPLSSNVCAVCATVRQQQNEPSPARRAVKKNKAPQTPQKLDQTYLQLVNLDNKDLVETREPFECVVCFSEVAPGEGVTLRECLHQFCKLCLAHTVQYTEDAEVKCPYRDDEYSCNIAIQDREIKALVTPAVYDNYLAKSVKEAENKIGKSFHCKTPDCKGWCIFEDNVNEFRCPVCRRINCLTCQAIHSGLNCKQYQEKMNQESEIDEDAKRTKEMVDEMVKKGEALTCPTCHVILMKKWGCDWVRCSMCKTEICWVTRGPRWGPAGKGDTTGGCQCGVNGVKCHPQCSYCH